MGRGHFSARTQSAGNIPTKGIRQRRDTGAASLQTGVPLPLASLCPGPRVHPYLLALLGKMRNSPLLPREQSGQTRALVLDLLFFGGLKHMPIPEQGFPQPRHPLVWAQGGWDSQVREGMSEGSKARLREGLPRGPPGPSQLRKQTQPPKPRSPKAESPEPTSQASLRVGSADVPHPCVHHAGTPTSCSPTSKGPGAQKGGNGGAAMGGCSGTQEPRVRPCDPAPASRLCPRRRCRFPRCPRISSFA